MIQDSRFKIQDLRFKIQDLALPSKYKLLRGLLSLFLILESIFLFLPPSALAAGSGYISASGGGTKTAGSNFTVSVFAGGTTFDSLQGKISVVGPVTIVSFYAGSATWLPGKSPANNNQFVGITSARSSLTVATITLRGTSTGSGYVSVSGVRLAYSGSEVGTSGGSTSFTIIPAPTPPGSVAVSSSTHPNQEKSYDSPDIKLSWKAPSNGANGYSYVFDSKNKTTPPTKIKTTKTAVEFKGNKVGTYYFHIRPNNSDGWGPTTHFKITVVPQTDQSLAIPAIIEITTTDDHSNDLDHGTLTGIKITGTGPAGYNVELTITPDWELDSKKYPAPIIGADGTWQLIVNSPIAAGYYQLVVRAKKDSQATSPSPTVGFEVSVAEGGKVTVVLSTDETEAYQIAQANQTSLVAAQKSKDRNFGIAGLGLILVIFGILFYLKRQLIFG
ncbi:MAG: hypothetical protein WD157_00525 [Patescibacteria group bacterium]